MEISGATVIAEALPGIEHVVLRSRRKRSEIRKSAEPFMIIGNYSGNLGLLEHEFRDKDCVGIASPAPGKIASVVAKPLKKRSTKNADASR